MRNTILTFLTILTLGLNFTSCSKSDDDAIVEEPQERVFVLTYNWVIEFEVYRDFRVYKERATQVMFVDEVTHKVVGSKLYSGYDATRPVRNDVELKAIGEWIDIAEYEDVYYGRTVWYGND